MKTLHILQCTNLGGMEQTTLARIRALKSAGHDVKLISLNPVGELGGLLKKERIPTKGLRYRGLYGLGGVYEMWRAFHDAKPDAIVMHGPNVAAMLAMGMLCRGNRVLMVHFHHTGVKSTALWKLLYYIAARQFDTITFASSFIRNEAIRICPWVEAISCTLQNHFDVPDLPTLEDKVKARQTLGLPLSSVIVGNAGWLIERKRFDVFLVSAGKLLRRIPNVQFAIAGDGPLRCELERQAEREGIAKHLHWLGWVKDMQVFYRAINILEFNSDWDALGRTPIEALAAGVPVVATVVNGGLCEVIHNDEVGFLSDTHDSDWIASKMEELIRDSELRARIIRAGRERVLELCSPEKERSRVEALLHGSRR